MKNLTKTQALAYLRLKPVSDKLSMDTRNSIDSGKLSLKSVVAYVRKQVTFGGTVPLVSSNTKQLVGITNLEGNRLPAYRNIVFNAIAIGYSADADDAKETALAYETTLPASLRNAEIEIKQDSKVIVRQAISEFNADHAFTHEGERYVYLGGEHMLREEKPFEINIVFPEGAVGGGTKDYVEVRLAGIETSEQ